MHEVRKSIREREERRESVCVCERFPKRDRGGCAGVCRCRCRGMFV
jgi:hypothetical protein